MSDIAILKEMIKDTAVISLEDDPYGYDKKNPKKLVILTEPEVPNCFVTIRGMPDNAIVIKADAFKSPDTVFKGLKGQCKRADFVIVADTGEKKVILCIEMKKTKDLEEKIIQQLRGTLCFIVYCREVGKEFWKQADFLSDYVYRFVSLTHLSISKKAFCIPPKIGIQDRPEQMLKIIYPDYLRFDQLVGQGCPKM
jgi:hypothetical protein